MAVCCCVRWSCLLLILVLLRLLAILFLGLLSASSLQIVLLPLWLRLLHKEYGYTHAIDMQSADPQAGCMQDAIRVRKVRHRNKQMWCISNDI